MILVGGHPDGCPSAGQTHGGPASSLDCETARACLPAPLLGQCCGIYNTMHVADGMVSLPLLWPASLRMHTQDINTFVLFVQVIICTDGLANKGVGSLDGMLQ